MNYDGVSIKKTCSNFGTGFLGLVHRKWFVLFIGYLFYPLLCIKNLAVVVV